MKEFQFKKKIKKKTDVTKWGLIGEIHNEYTEDKEKIEKRLKKFETSLKNLSEKEVSNLKSKYEKDIFESMCVIIFLFTVFSIYVYNLIDRFFFNLQFTKLKIPVINYEISYSYEFLFFFLVCFIGVGCIFVWREDKKKLELINKFK